MRLILASASPRRRQLLTEAGYPFEVIVPSASAECGACSSGGPAELVAEFARRKAASVQKKGTGAFSDAVVIAADTVAECDGQILGKPVDEDHARDMLRRLSGRKHRVYSGICVWAPSKTALVRVAVTTLRMDGLSEPQLEAYLASGGWQGKAGAFGYQDGLDWVHILEGSASNVVGLPMELLGEMLREVGLSRSDTQ